ncbi:ROK family transcriptional regulator [Curtobacterium flaccumfaciens]|uniref:ROK family transcriptional regulator n=1 Tax=Curtobacterium flaccumfaciens TaxID=2035 RepID=UPI001366F0E3|nr:ROK family transcriptional regulator [Curtobacterium flaccumfaciens]MBT1667671.1 ROK family transcriptional regulator [Curtobacterium flaccumfaciens pv. flaccumfaciens]QHN62963.1 ROK family transcriptional regulator [Curtobacterium flaccumfaciens pv. flaccumfaciens]
MQQTVSTTPGAAGSTPGAVGTTPGVLRQMNSRAILDELLRDDVSRTVTELGRTVGLSRPTVEAALADLVDEGWVTEAEAIATPNKAGRRAKRFAADASAGSVLGVDLGLHGIVGVRADLRGVTLARVEERYTDLADAEQAWSSVQDVVRRLTAPVGGTVGGSAGGAPVLGATFGVPAVVDRDGAIDYTVAVPEWVERRVPGRIQDLFPWVATFFDNDAKLAATAEARWGRFHGVRDGLYLVMGRQIGAALVVDGSLARGARGAAGEMGGIASTGWPAAPARLEARIPSGTDLESVFAAAAQGSVSAVETVRAFAADVAPGVVQLVTTIDPEVVVVGGEVLPAAEVFCAALDEIVTPQLRHPVVFAPSTVGRDAVARGALARSLAHVRSAHMGLG